MYDVQCTMYDESVNCHLSIVTCQLSTERSDNSYNSLTPKKLSTCETLVILYYFFGANGATFYTEFTFTFVLAHQIV